jgi:predicted PurR-regulated permease PerM
MHILPNDLLNLTLTTFLTQIKPFIMPFLFRFAAVSLILFLMVLTIVYAQGVIIPLYFSLLLAILLRKPVKFFEVRLKMGAIPAILLVETLAFSVLTILFTAIIYETKEFASDWEAIERNILTHLLNVQQWIVQRFGISYAEQTDYLKMAADNTFDRGGSMVTDTISSLSNTLFNLFLIPVYVFLFLAYHERLTNFWLVVFGQDNEQTVRKALISVRGIIQSYLSGIMIEMAVVAGLNATGLLLLGVEYAVFLGLLSAFLNLIPYIGTIIAGILGVIVTLSTTDQLSKVGGVILIFWIVQLIDNNLLMPRIVGRKVKINALVSIIAVLIGGAMAGISGMFLSIPTIAVLKVVFDHAKGMKPWGDLLGEDPPAIRSERPNFVRYILSTTWYPGHSSPKPRSDHGNEIKPSDDNEKEV